MATNSNPFSILNGKPVSKFIAIYEGADNGLDYVTPDMMAEMIPAGAGNGENIVVEVGEEDATIVLRILNTARLRNPGANEKMRNVILVNGDGVCITDANSAATIGLPKCFAYASLGGGLYTVEGGHIDAGVGGHIILKRITLEDLEMQNYPAWANFVVGTLGSTPNPLYTFVSTQTLKNMLANIDEKQSPLLLLTQMVNPTNGRTGIVAYGFTNNGTINGSTLVVGNPGPVSGKEMKTEDLALTARMLLIQPFMQG
jgi:hypothetical protein